MTRARIVAAAAAAALAAVAAVAAVACSGPSCKPGTLALRIGLIDGAQAADTFIVTGDDPNAVVSMTFPHVPNMVFDAAENFDVTITWPTGYPTYTTVHLTVRALAAGQLIAFNNQTIRLDPSCTSSSIILSTQSDTAADDGGATD
jgi:hypothetical protein